MLFLISVMVLGQTSGLPPPARRQLVWGKHTTCVTLKPTAAVPSGLFRVQCDLPAGECLAAPTHVLVDGVEGEEELARVPPCATWEDRLISQALKENVRVVDAVAEAPDGWYRDERGRVFQVNFDLHRRVYFGGGYSPGFGPVFGGRFARGRTDFGVEIDWDADEHKVVHRLHLLEGSLWVGDEVRFDGALARYDFSSDRQKAPLWLTTFVGAPRRFDIPLNLTAYVELLRFEALGGRGFLTLASAQAVLELWHARDLDSYVRLRVGPGLELDTVSKGLMLKPEAALEAEFSLDRDGFHHLNASLSAEKLFLDAADPGRHLNPQRLRAKVGYELILVAINDYPLTLVVDGRAAWRDDLPGVRPGWDFGAFAGLRMSFWAPARRNADPVARR